MKCAIRSRSPYGARRHDLIRWERLLAESALLEHVATSRVRRQLGRQLPPRRRAPHVERLDEALLNVALVRHICDPLDDVAGQGSPVVGVANLYAGLAHARGYMGGEPLADGHHRLRAGRQHPDVAVLEARRARHKVPERDRLRVGVRDAEVQVGVHVGVELELTLFDELHHRRPCEQLGVRPDVKEAAIGCDRHPLLNVGPAVAFGKEGPPVTHDRHRRTRDAALFQLLGDQFVEERFHFLCIAETIRGRTVGAGGGRGGFPSWFLAAGPGRREERKPPTRTPAIRGKRHTFFMTLPISSRTRTTSYPWSGPSPAPGGASSKRILALSVCQAPLAILRRCPVPSPYEMAPRPVALLPSHS